MSDVIDPGAHTASAVKRGIFMGISAGALGASSIAAALAQGTGLGKPHPPLVAEDDPAIVVERPSLVRPDGPIDAYLAAPKNANAQTPSVVVVMHVWGVDSQIRDVVRRYAKEGFVAIAPDLYARQHLAPGDNGSTDFATYRGAAAKLDQTVVTGDLESAAAYLRKRGSAAANTPARVGITGFCMGGAIALRNSATKTYDAASLWYGPIRQTKPDAPITDAQLAFADAITIPVMGSYGGRDTSIPAADVLALEKHLRGPHDFKLYDQAGHAFNDDTRESYVASAAADGWTRTLAWFRRYLAPT